MLVWFDLCQDNNKKFKRLKKAGRVTGEKGSGGIGLSDEDDEEEGGGRRGRTAEEELKRSLFGDDEGVVPKRLMFCPAGYFCIVLHI
jgi:hypothetical protein